MKLDWKLFFLLVIAFIIFTAIGTVAHEFGHYFAAESVGIDAEVHYGYTSFQNSTEEQWQSLTFWENVWITLGGPLQTILTGTLGFILILMYRKSFLNSTKLNWKQWFLVILTFFWSRQIANFGMGLVFYLISGKTSKRDDESELDFYFGVPENSTGLITCVIALIICGIVTFKYVPKNQRITFILAGFVGCSIGFMFWLEWFGPIILP